MTCEACLNLRASGRQPCRRQDRQPLTAVEGRFLPLGSGARVKHPAVINDVKSKKIPLMLRYRPRADCWHTSSFSGSRQVQSAVRGVINAATGLNWPG